MMTQIAVTDVFVRRGILFLCSENVDVLGGSVPRLIEARNASRLALQKDPSEICCVRFIKDRRFLLRTWRHKANNQ